MEFKRRGSDPDFSESAITEKLNKFGCNPVFMKMHGEAAAFVPRNPCAIVVRVSEVEDTLKRLKTPQSRKKPVIVAGVTEILVIPHPYNRFFKGYLIYANEERVIPPGGTIIPTGEVKNKQVNARN